MATYTFWVGVTCYEFHTKLHLEGMESGHGFIELPSGSYLKIEGVEDGELVLSPEPSSPGSDDTIYPAYEVPTDR